MNIALEILAARDLTGLGVYTRGISAALVKSFPYVNWTLIGDPTSLSSVSSVLSSDGLPPRVNFVSLSNDSIPGFNGGLPDTQVLRAWQNIVGQYLANCHYDLIYCPTFYLPLHENLPPIVATIHDVLFHTMPESPGGKWPLFFEEATSDACARASAITCNSLATERDLLRFYTVPSNRVYVVFHAINSVYSPAEFVRIESFRQKYGLLEPYVLNITGAWKRRKNSHCLLRAYEILQGMLGNAAPNLVIVSRHLFDNPGVLGRMPSGTRVISYVPEADMPALITGCEAVVCPSIAEGFGLPVLEGLACGKPVVASNLPVFRETAGDLAVFVDQNDPREIASGIIEAINMKGADGIVMRRIQRARRFNWAATAANTMTIFENVLRIGPHARD